MAQQQQPAPASSSTAKLSVSVSPRHTTGGSGSGTRRPLTSRGSISGWEAERSLATSGRTESSPSLVIDEDSTMLVQRVEWLNHEVAHLKAQLASSIAASTSSGHGGDSSTPTQETAAVEVVDEDLARELAVGSLSIVVIGASGDLAAKKTYPALFHLYERQLLPDHVSIVGYARSSMTSEAFRERIGKGLKPLHKESPADLKTRFLAKCSYISGQYDAGADFEALGAKLGTLEQGRPGPSGTSKCANRLFYFAIPPTIFASVATNIHRHAVTTCGFNRVIIEKPFGRDLASSNELAATVSANFKESQIFRIDHYTAKELVQNLMVLRFANMAFQPQWNRHHIKCVMVTFKEPIGLQGRAGYFDEFGIIRDVMQNHLMQLVTLIGMEQPVSSNAADIRDEKVKFLKFVRPIVPSDVVVGQFTRGVGPDGVEEPGYLEDADVPADSVTPTFAMAVLHVDNPRWAGVPFILKCGKGLNERKAEIRIQFEPVAAGHLFPTPPSNELVIRVQPNEAIYMKIMSKKPGLSKLELEHTTLDLTYAWQFDLTESGGLPEAYERLILDSLKGDQSLFVRSDELKASWEIFTPLLHHLEGKGPDGVPVKPGGYRFGTRGMAEADELAFRYGFVRDEKYRWVDRDEKAKL